MHLLTAIASCCVVAGLIALGNRRRYGWVFQFVGSALSVVHFYFFVYDLSVVVLNLILCVIAARSWWHWRGRRG